MYTYLKSFVLLMLLSSNMAFAGLIVQSGGLSGMTDFQNPSDTSFATSDDGDIVQFTLLNGGPSYDMTIGDSSNAADSWWSGNDQGFYYTPIAADGGTNWLELIMPTNTVSFSLSMDANFSALGWIVGVDSLGGTIDTNGGTPTLQSDGTFSNPNPGTFSVGNGDDKTFSFIAGNTGGTCSTITKVVVDPNRLWGIGDFAINVDDNACQVPEPSVIALFAVGLIGLGFARRSRA